VQEISNRIVACCLVNTEHCKELRRTGKFDTSTIEEHEMIAITTVAISRPVARRAVLILALLFLAMMTSVCPAETNTPTARAENKARVESTFREMQKKHAGNPDILVLPGLVADRSNKIVRIQAEATGMPSHLQTEFMLITEGSGHDYEALAVSFAKPSDIHKALEFIGLKPGRPVNPEKLASWPKGERVIVYFNWTLPAGNAGITNANGPFHVRGETLMIDRRNNGKPLPESGFVFTGSIRKPGRANTNVQVYAADEYSPNCIGSYFNDIETVLDVPRQAPQGYVYDYQYPNPAFVFATNQAVEITMEPEYRDGRERVKDLNLRISGSADAATNLLWDLRGKDGKPAAGDTQIASVLAAFDRMVQDGCDPYVTVDFDNAIPLKTVHETCLLLAAIDRDGGIRIEPPPDGRLHYKAFTPREEMRNPANRIAEPWELKLVNMRGILSGELTLDDETYDGQNDTWSKFKREYPIHAPEDFNKAMLTAGKDGTPIGPPGVFVFAPPNTPYGKLCELLPHHIPGRPTVYYHIYVETLPAAAKFTRQFIE